MQQKALRATRCNKKPCIHSKEPYAGVRKVCAATCNYEPYVRLDATQSPTSTQRSPIQVCAKCVQLYATKGPRCATRYNKEPYIHSKEPYIHSKEPYAGMREVCVAICTYEPYIQSKGLFPLLQTSLCDWS